jgi:hypothetical protein
LNQKYTISSIKHSPYFFFEFNSKRKNPAKKTNLPCGYINFIVKVQPTKYPTLKKSSMFFPPEK